MTISKPIHPAARDYADEVAAGSLSRREFLTRATALGVSASAAYGLLGLIQPVRAAAHAQTGGTLRIESSIKALKDPRTFDWPQMSNFTRGYLGIWSNTRSTAASSLPCWKAGRSTTTPPSTR